MQLDIPVRTLMTGEVEAIRRDAGLTDALTAMVNGGYHHLPVVEDGGVVGMLSVTDLYGALQGQAPELQDTGVVLDDRTVGDLMSKPVVAVQADAPVRDAVELFANNPFHALPVVAGFRLVGIVTTRDVCRHLLADA